MDGIKLPSLSIPTVRVPGAKDSGIVEGKTIFITSASDSVKLRINEKAYIYAITPYVPNKIVIEVDTVKDIYLLCEQDTNIISLDFRHLDLTNLIWIYNAFNGCINLISVKFGDIDTSKCTLMRSLFWYCTKLKTLDISKFDFTAVTGTERMFMCPELTNLKFGHNLKVSISLTGAPLTHESALSVLNGLAEVDTPQTVSFTKSAYNTLTEEEIALATSKGWTITS